MRRLCFVLSLIVPIVAFAGEHKSSAPMPQEFEVGRHTFFDFGPPFDFYEVFVIRPSLNGATIYRMTLTPPGNVCFQPAKYEVAAGSSAKSPAELLGTNPCTIPERKIRRELKRKKKGLVFSGADVALRVQCGPKTRIVRADVLDRDMFDPAPGTPEHTSWTMQLLSTLDGAVGPGVMDRPAFAVSDGDNGTNSQKASTLDRDIESGKFDGLFDPTSNIVSGIYRESREVIPAPTVKVTEITLQPDVMDPVKYPPIARAASIEGEVRFSLTVNEIGNVGEFRLVSGHPMLVPMVKEATSHWHFSQAEALKATVNGTIQFSLNCAARASVN